MYFTIRGYGCTVIQREDGIFTATCEPAAGTVLQLKAKTLEEARLDMRAALDEYEAEMLDLETTLNVKPPKEEP
jgi:hypothetical protein